MCKQLTLPRYHHRIGKVDQKIVVEALGLGPTALEPRPGGAITGGKG